MFIYGKKTNRESCLFIYRIRNQSRGNSGDPCHGNPGEISRFPNRLTKESESGKSCCYVAMLFMSLSRRNMDVYSTAKGVALSCKVFVFFLCLTDQDLISFI
ncbi:hypothetical protein CEXT_24181 [Caerostris extrusa]|uniref:Uncharacterized protein n=1 Tax=Caerostris extrusa TaxID=172846 RepID=A0AAV4RZA3_CAEEX|nr:hypothetical protein CEXT_24181 [Caerostris extrusa]